MEPTIYKPSIYNAPTIYNTGSGGGAYIGGKRYKTVVMPDGKEWLAENLDFKFCDIGSGGLPTTPNAWYYNNDESVFGWNGYKCGLLYNWYAVKFLNDNKSDLCPGWHAPTDLEWSTLVTACGDDAGTKLKAIDNSVVQGFPSEWNGTDNFRFSILPAGYRVKTFQSIGSSSPIWTCSDTLYDAGIQYYLDYNSSNVGRAEQNSKVEAFSVRLVKD